jgi:hypothetical protein
MYLAIKTRRPKDRSRCVRKNAKHHAKNRRRHQRLSPA